MSRSMREPEHRSTDPVIVRVRSVEPENETDTGQHDVRERLTRGAAVHSNKNEKQAYFFQNGPMSKNKSEK